MIDLAALFRVWNDQQGRFSYFSQNHVGAVWLGDTEAAKNAHDAVGDAQKSMTLFHCYAATQMDPGRLMSFHHATLTAQKTPSFAMQNPSFEGV